MHEHTTPSFKKSVLAIKTDYMANSFPFPSPLFPSPETFLILSELQQKCVKGRKQENGEGSFNRALVLTFQCGGRCVEERKRRFLLLSTQVRLSTDSRSCQITSYICSYLEVLHVTREDQIFIYLFIFSQGLNSAQQKYSPWTTCSLQNGLNPLI